MDEGSDPARIVHQDRHRHSRRLPRNRLGGEVELGDRADVPWSGINHRRLPDILVGRVLRGARVVQFSREWAAPLASGISDLRGAAAIATGAAIRARPVIPIMVSSLVVIFAVVELLILPFIAGYILDQQPMAAGAWMALSVKTDGAAVASGSITEALILAKAAAQGHQISARLDPGTAATVKVFIDIFIGVWAFVLAWIGPGISRCVRAIRQKSARSGSVSLSSLSAMS